MTAAFATGLAEGLAFEDGAAALGATLEGAFAAAFAAAFATGLAAGRAAAFTAGLTVLVAAVLFFAADARAWAPDAAGLPDFAVLVAGAFTTGLLSVTDEAGSRAVRRALLARAGITVGRRRMRRYTLIAPRRCTSAHQAP
ncbi:hypothetical protein [Hydrogenophaga sp.]